MGASVMGGEDLDILVAIAAILLVLNPKVRKMNAVVEVRQVKLLQGAFNVDRDAVAGKRILLVDDLYRSGATATVVAQGLLEGRAAAVDMLAMTKTRTRT